MKLTSGLSPCHRTFRKAYKRRKCFPVALLVIRLYIQLFSLLSPRPFGACRLHTLLLDLNICLSLRSPFFVPCPNQLDLDQAMATQPFDFDVIFESGPDVLAQPLPGLITTTVFKRPLIPDIDSGSIRNQEFGLLSGKRFASWSTSTASTLGAYPYVPTACSKIEITSPMNRWGQRFQALTMGLRSNRR